MALIITSYAPEYCGKCREGFLTKTLASGEEVITPCPCKLDQDRAHLYKQINQGATIQMYGYKGWKYENKAEWLPGIAERSESLPINAFESLHRDCLSTTSTRFTGFSKFLKWVGEVDPNLNPRNFYLDNQRGSNQRFLYFLNFVAYVLVKRLIPVKYLDYSELKSLVLDKDKNFYEVLSPYSVVIIPELFSDDFLTSIENTFVFDKVNRLFKYLYSSGEVSVIVAGSKGVREIRTLAVAQNKPTVFERSQALFNTILNNSNVVCCRILEE